MVARSLRTPRTRERVHRVKRKALLAEIHEKEIESEIVAWQHRSKESRLMVQSPESSCWKLLPMSGSLGKHIGQRARRRLS
jgi:hypothetical protein